MNDEYLIYGETLTNIADSIRSVSNVSTKWTPDEMAAYILANLVKPTTRQAAKTYTPGTSNQTIPAGTFLTGAATIAGDADLTVGNIKKGVNIFGKTGTLSGAWGDASKFGGISKVSSGSFTLTSSTAAMDYSISHGLGAIPKIAAVMLGTGNNYNLGMINSSTTTGLVMIVRVSYNDNTLIEYSYAGEPGFIYNNPGTRYIYSRVAHPNFYSSTNDVSSKLMTFSSTQITLNVKYETGAYEFLSVGLVGELTIPYSVLCASVGG